MKTLFKLELQKNIIRTYVAASLVIAFTMLGFLYLFAYAPMLEPNDKDMAIFSGYHNLIPLFGVLNMAVFCVLSAVMYSKFIIEDYTGKRIILLFSYPVSRKKIMLSKLGIVYLFTVISMVASNIAIFLVFGLTEQFIHLINESLTLFILAQAIEITLIMSFIAASTGIIAAGIGFVKKSVPTTIVSAVLIASLMCNIVVNATANKAVLYLLAIVILTIAFIVSILLMKQVNRMEVE